MRLSLFRDKELYFFAAAFGAQPLTDDLGLFNLLRQHHLLWNGRRLGVELHDELFHHFRIGFILRPFKDEILTAYQLAAANEENLYTGLTVTACHGKHI